MKRLKILITGGPDSSAPTSATPASMPATRSRSSTTSRREISATSTPRQKYTSAISADENKIAAVFSKGGFDVVCHHAAQIDVRKSVEDPKFDASVNILGTLNILKHAVKNKVRKVIFASSGGTIYGECGKSAPDETAPGRPLSPYGITKYSVEILPQFLQQPSRPQIYRPQVR